MMNYQLLFEVVVVILNLNLLVILLLALWFLRMIPLQALMALMEKNPPLLRTSLSNLARPEMLPLLMFTRMMIPSSVLVIQRLVTLMTLMRMTPSPHPSFARLEVLLVSHATSSCFKHGRLSQILHFYELVTSQYPFSPRKPTANLHVFQVLMIYQQL
jgi:hypothetical protein